MTVPRRHRGLKTSQYWDGSIYDTLLLWRNYKTSQCREGTRCWYHVKKMIPNSHTLHSDFHYETYIGISPYRTLAVGLVWTAIYGSHVKCDLIVREHTKVAHFSYDMGKYRMNKVFAWRLTPYSLDECCIFPYRTQMNISYCAEKASLQETMSMSIFIAKLNATSP